VFWREIMRQSFRGLKKKPENTSAKKALDSLLEKVGFDPSKYAIFEIWDRESQRVIQGCNAVALQGSKLCVSVPSVIHRQELLYSKDRVIKRINQAMGQKLITDIRFELKE